MEQQTVLVTGGHGFIGMAVCRELVARGHVVDRLDRATGGDVTDQLAVREAMIGHDTVVHLAGVLGTSELLESIHAAVDVNVLGSANVLAAARDQGARYVGITMPDCWPSMYQATKICAQRVADAFANAWSLSTVHVRTFNVYGPGQAYGAGHPQKILPTFAVAAHRRLPLPIWGEGTNTVDLVHVDDVARTFADVVEHPDLGGVVDCGSGVETSVVDVASAVCHAAGAPCELLSLPMRAGELEGTRLAASDFGPFPPAEYFLDDPRFPESVEAYRRFA